MRILRLLTGCGRCGGVTLMGPQMAAVYGKYLERGGGPTFSPHDAIAFDSAWSSLLESAQSEDYVRDMLINERLGELLTMLMREAWPMEQSPANTEDAIARVHNYLSAHHAEHVSLDALSDRFFLNKSHLAREFRKRYGVTIMVYVMEQRITQAKRLLRFSEQSVQEVGEACGMENAAYFSRVFKRLEDVSPSEFRGAWRQSGR